MVFPVLVATPSSGFGALIQQVLEEDGHYQVVLVNKGADAIRQALATPFRLGILDSDLLDIPLAELVPALRKYSPDIRLIIVPPDDIHTNRSVVEYTPDGYISKPFYPPDLINLLERIFPQELPEDHISSTVEKPDQPEYTSESVLKAHSYIPSQDLVWLQDVNRVAQYLTRLTLESSAQAALILCGAKLWAYAGGLSQAGVEELTAKAADYWEDDGSSDLARFIRLEATHREYLLYATPLADGVILVLAYDTEIPFNKIRTQAGRLARALSSPPPEENEGGVTPLATSFEAPVSDDTSMALPPALQQESPQSPLFDDVPPPSPTGWYPAPIFPDQEQPSETTLDREVEVEASAGIDELYDTDLGERRRGFQPVRAVMCDLGYAFMLVPCLPKHHLVGKLVEALEGWIGNLCLAFGWRLEHISLQPDYLLLSVHADPDVAPAEIVQLIRQHSSRRIFSEFPHFAEDNPSGDFWAPSYLAMSGTQSPPVSVMREFIQQTRQRQGTFRAGM